MERQNPTPLGSDMFFVDSFCCLLSCLPWVVPPSNSEKKWRFYRDSLLKIWETLVVRGSTTTWQPSGSQRYPKYKSISKRLRFNDLNIPYSYSKNRISLPLKKRLYVYICKWWVMCFPQTQGLKPFWELKSPYLHPSGGRGGSTCLKYKIPWDLSNPKNVGKRTTRCHDFDVMCVFFGWVFGCNDWKWSK